MGQPRDQGVEVPAFRGWGSGFRVFGFRVQGLGLRVLGFGA